jgi:CARDB
MVCNISYAANWTRSGNITLKKWDEKGPLVFGTLGNPPPNNNSCSSNENPPDHTLTFDISILARNAGDAFDVNKIYVNGAGASGEAALLFWLGEWLAHTGNFSLPPLIVGSNWSGVNTISICVGGLTYGAFPNKIQSVFFWYNGSISTTQQPFPIGRPAGDPMDMGETEDALAVANNGVRVADLNGSGIATHETESPNPGKPDFVVIRNWLETVGGVEQYVFSKNDEIKMKGQFKNVGDGEIPNDATIHSRVYLSKGYKEDSHNEWIRVGTDETRGDSLDIGETHTETEGLKLWEYSEIIPGKTYNIVWCIDRIADQNNGSGDWIEKHESNNCSTEAVFTVSGSFNFHITSLALGGGKTNLNVGETFSVDATAHNAGDSAPRDTRVGYFLSGGDIQGEMLIGTDAIKEEDFTAGISKSETLNSVVAPITAGAYVLHACTDYDNRVQETNEGDNCMSISVSVVNPSVPDPAPKRVNPATLQMLFGN